MTNPDDSLEKIKARVAEAPRFTLCHGPSPGGNHRYQLATADDNCACIAYGAAIADLVFCAANDINYLIERLALVERTLAEYRALYGLRSDDEQP